MSRLDATFRQKDPKRFVLLYGQGISDIYYDQEEEGKEIPFLYALTQIYQKHGYLRVFHISPSEPLHVIDPISEELSPGFFWKGRSEVLKTGIINTIQTGPLGEIKNDHPQNQNTSGLGDNHGLRVVDHYLKEHSKFRTLFVIYQAESFLSYFSNKRLLSGLISEWLHLGSSNENKIIFIFNSESQDDLKRAVENSQIAELRQVLYGSDSVVSSCERIDGPDSDEIFELINKVMKEKELIVETDNFNKIIDWMERENVQLRIWQNRLQSLNTFSLSTLKENHWLVSTLEDPRSIEEKLGDFVGLESVKQKILELKKWISFETSTGAQRSEHNLHMVFLGNPGTGKTSIARLMGEMFHDYGILTKGHLIAVNGLDLVADVVGGSTNKTNQVIQKAIGGVLFIDEAYALVEKERGGFGLEVVDTLVPVLENQRKDIVVVLAGYPEKMRKFLKSNPGLDRRFPESNRLLFEDFTANELLQILQKELLERGLLLSDVSNNALISVIEGLLSEKNENFGNAGEMRNLAEGIERLCKGRNIDVSNIDLTVFPQDIPARYAFFLKQEIPPVESILSELDELVGLSTVKKYFETQVRLIQYEQIRKSVLADVPTIINLENYVFVGNPGTGKTTVARLIGKLYQSLGLLRNGHTVEVSAVDLIAGYVGQTSIQTREIFEKALDGVLFIDEAYSLLGDKSNHNSYAVDATNTLVKLIEDFRSRIVVILAGYPKPMSDLLASNPGLRSRFSNLISFEDFSNEELSLILTNFVAQEQYTISKDALSTAVFLLETARLVDPSTFGNAREVRNLFQLMKKNLAVRVVSQKNRKSSSLPENWNQFIKEDLNGYVHNRPIDNSVSQLYNDEDHFFRPKSPPPQ